MPADPYLGDISIFAGNFAPRGWAMCEGQLLPISQYSALFSIMGTMYGGDGRTTFALPDLRGRMPIGIGNGPGLTSRRQGQKGGREDVVLTIGEMPNHQHSPRLHAEQALGDKPTPRDNMLAGTASNPYAAPVLNDNIPMAADCITESAVGGNLPFDNMNPFIAMNFIIALEGIFPSRS